MIFSSWWFWIIVIAIIGLVVAIILFFATDVNRLTVYILLGVFILLLILGIVFAIRSYRKPKPKQNFGDRFIPGFSEGRVIAGKTGLSDLRRKVTGSTTGALGSAGSGARKFWNNPRFRTFAKQQGKAIGATILFGYAGAGFIGGPTALKGVFRNKSLTEQNRRKAIQNKQKKLEEQQQIQQLNQQSQQLDQQLQQGGMPQQQMGGMPQQQMGGMPQQQMDGMPQQQMGGMPQQQMDGMPQQQMGGMPQQQQMVPQY